MDQPSRSPIKPALVLAAGSLLLMVGILLYIPYSFGVGTERFSLGALLWQAWQGEEMQHGVLVVPGALAIMYLRRNDLSHLAIRSSYIGLAVLLLGLLLFYAGYRGDVFAVGEISLWLALVGGVYWMWGWQVLKILSFPLAFLLFAFPLPGSDMLVTFPLRMIMSKASVAVLNFIGVPVILQGTGILSAPDALTGLRPGQRFSVDVADPCSGIRSLFALMMVSALYGYFTMKEGWQKAVLFLCSIPLAILGNLCRILMLTFGTMAMGPAVAIGTLENPSFFHMAAGYVVFAVALGGMIGTGWILQMLPVWIARARPSIQSNPEVEVGSKHLEQGKTSTRSPVKPVDPY